MGRPADWDVLDLDRDPVPGDPYEVKELAGKLGAFADDVAAALRSVRGLGGDTVIQSWAGLSGDAYREQFGDLPGELDKLERSYRLASGALDGYWPQLETAQADADRALAQGRQARADLDAAKSQLTNADAWVKRAQDKSKQYQDDPKPGVPPPSEQDVRDATRNATAAGNAHTTASTAVHDAQSRLDAAKELAAQAAGVRDTAASVAEHALHEASDAGIHNKHWWEKAVDFVADHWDDIVAACKIIVAVLGIVVMIIGGPLAWLVLAAAVIVLADTVSKYLQGKASLWDVAFAALDCIPMFKGLTTAGGLLKMARELPTLLKSGEALERIATSIRKGGTALRETGRDIKKLVTCGDPVDVATGELIMSAVDVELPGALPLMLERHHRSSFRDGRLFGPSWSSTLDQRLRLDEQGVVFTTADAMTLYYPVPEAGTPVMPSEGPRWPLTWNGSPGAAMTVGQPETGLTLHFGAARQRDTALSLLAVTDRNGNRIDVVYDADGVPCEVVHAAGYRVGVDRAGGRIAGFRLLSHPDRPVVMSYGYDADGARGNLAEVVNSSGAPLRFGYDADHRITSWEDRNGTWYRYEYDERGRCVFSTGTDRLLEYRYAYDDAARRTTATNVLGHATTYQFNELFQLVAETDPLGHTTTRTWDRYDRILSRTDPLGDTTWFHYDDAGRPVAVVRPDGTRVTARNGPHGLPVTFTQADGHVWRLEYDDAGNLTAETDPTGARVSYRYDTAGAVRAVTDAAGRTVLIENDAAGMPIATTDAAGATTSLARDAFGRLVAQTGPDGAVTRFSWTVEGRLSARLLPDGSREQRVYDDEGNLVAHIDPAGRLTRFEYGGFDQPVARTDPDGSRLEFAYDCDLRVTSVTNPVGSVWRYLYDAAGRLTREEDFSGRSQTYRHDAAGNLLEQTNGAGQTIAYVRDAMGRITEQRTAEGVTTYRYDPEGNVVHVRGRDAELTYERDARGRVLAETCNGATLRSAYDVLGRRVRRVTPSGAESLWEFDGRDRPVLLRTAGRTVTFGYDAAGREVERRAGAAVLTQTWEPGGRLSTQTLTAQDRPGSAGGRQIQHRTYRYRPDGTVDRIGDLLLGDRTLDVDRTGRVTRVQAATWAEQYAYDAAGALTERHWEPGPAVDQGGDRRAHGTADVHHEHDAQGRVVVRRRKRLSRKPDVWRYTWDSEDRLVAAVTPEGARWEYRYDPYGRRIAKERLAPDGSGVVERTLFAWDGFVLAEQTTLAADGSVHCTAWDWERDRFSPVTQVERVAAGRGAPRPADPASADRAPGDWDSGGRASDGRDSDDRRLAALGVTDWHAADQQFVDAEFYAIVTDLVGTPSELVDEHGALAWQARTTIWGAALPAAPPGRARCPLRFPGQYHDAETGLHYNYHRHYDPETGQYASLDPLGLAPGPDPRGYVPNPFTAIDPLGLAADCERALQAARDRANVEQRRPGANKHNRPTSAAGFKPKNYDGTFDGASIKGGGDHGLEPEIQAAYDRVPQEIKDRVGGQHARCGEPEALSKAVRAGVDPRGGTMAAVNVRAEGNPLHGTPKAACESCQHVADQLGITVVT